ncbi:Ig-like domain-containing protein [Curtobacterium sp. MCBA15_004]|uniref:Ig-like domain-containing protein n=1 Tax=unclassified Curtobacterium TaxID=257496 RepID=UPI0008DE79FE|nr:Ig-like domain-containing protein [Curtobacterium sp. MCBA15_004]WIA97344.1 Ig-like domain-containing protein [Curtobacterium sp. MCBA15_004]
MKSFLKAAAATGVAAATIATGLSFGPVATATPADDKASRTIADGTEFQLIIRDGDGYKAPMPPSYGNLNLVHFDSLADAHDATPTFVAHGAGIIGGRQFWTFATGDRCLSAATAYDDRRDTYATTCARPGQYQEIKWTIENGLPRTEGGRYLTSNLSPHNADHLAWSKERPSSKDFQFVESPFGLSASVADVDLENGTAKLVDGIAPDEATSVEVSYSNKDGKQVVGDQDVTDGKWGPAALRNLALGETTVHLAAYDGGDVISESDVTVDLPVTPLVATGAFGSAVDEVATISGTATPDTAINVYHGEKRIAMTTSADDGTYSVPVNAPNMPGTYDLTVTQTIRGEDATPQSVSLDYGTGVSITSPADEAELEPGDLLTVRGAAQSGSMVKVYEKGHADEVLAETVAGTGSTYRAVVRDLEDREYHLVVEAISKGYNRTTAELTVNPGKSTVADPTAAVSFDADVTKKATVAGTGVDGATITVKNGTTTLGTAKVGSNGEWSLPIDPLGAGKHTLTVEQTGIDGTQTTTTDADYGDAVSIQLPTTFTGGALTVTGQSSKGAQVTITSGGKQIDTFTVANDDGSFTRNLTGLGSGTVELVASAKSKGALVTDTTASSTAPITAESVQISSHVKNGTFVPGEQLFTGRGTVGATITFNVHGFNNPSYNQTTTVDQWGNWEIRRGLADTTYPLVSVKQTAQPGVTNELTNWNLRPYDGVGQPGDLELTNFKDGDFFNAGDQVFAGTATPGATIVFNPFGLDNPAVESYNITTKADEKTGKWEIRRGLAKVNYDRIAVRQEPAAQGKVNQIDNIRIAPYGWVGAPADLTVTSPTADSTATAGIQTFTGTATPGTKVTIYVWGDNPTNPTTGIANARGKWTINRNMGALPTKYNVRIVQEDAGDKVDTVRVPLTITQ